MNRTIGVSIPLALILLAFLGFVACTSEPTNSNRPVVDAANLAKIAPSPTSGPCEGPDIPARFNALKTLLEDPNTDLGDAQLNDQRKTYFKFLVEQEGSAGILVRVKGNIYGDDTPPKFRKLIMFLDKYMKKGCVSRVRFEADTTTAASTGFEWSACGVGMCPTPPLGECQACTMPANKPLPTPTP